MRVFIDTNVFLDLLFRREGFLADSLRVFDLAVDGKLEILISDLSIANIKYITRKDYSVERFLQISLPVTFDSQWIQLPTSHFQLPISKTSSKP